MDVSRRSALCAGCPSFAQFTFYSGKDIVGYELLKSSGSVTAGVASLTDLTRAFEACSSNPLCECVRVPACARAWVVYVGCGVCGVWGV